MCCYQRVEGLPAVVLPRDKDPFWDPVEPLLLGTAHLWLQSLAFRIPLEEQLEVLHMLHTWVLSDARWICLRLQVLGSEGTEEAILQAQLIPCTSTGLYDTYFSCKLTERCVFKKCIFPVHWGRTTSWLTRLKYWVDDWTSSWSWISVVGFVGLGKPAIGGYKLGEAWTDVFNI